MLESEDGKSSTTREPDLTSFKDYQPPPSPEEALAGIFALSKNLRCVVLNACYTNSLAEAITKEIDFVVGMTGPVGDSAAIDLAKGFFEAAANGLSIEQARASGYQRMQGYGEGYN